MSGILNAFAGGSYGAKPDAPTIGTASRTASQQVTVTYTAPSFNGGVAITSYTATSSPGGITGTVSQAGSGSIVVNGLTNGTAYTFTVTATNSIGTSAPSAASNSATPYTVADAPTIGTATATSTTQATVSFTAPASNGGSTITSYTAVSTPGSITGTLSQAGSGTITVNGLTTGTAYTFVVYATNAAGNSANSAASNSTTTYSVPVNSVAPAVTGTATFGQTLSTTNGTWTGTPASFTYTYQWQRVTTPISGATSSTYTLVQADVGSTIRCAVTATNSAGSTAANSNSTATVAATVPSAPTGVTASATGSSTASLSWTAPSNGGSNITQYNISWSGGSTTSATTSKSITGLSAGTSYSFTVTATNGVGTGSGGVSNTITTSNTQSWFAIGTNTNYYGYFGILQQYTYGSGFGTASSLPVVGGTNVSAGGFQFSPNSDILMLSSSGSPYLVAYAFNPDTGLGSSYGSPSSVNPSQLANAVFLGNGSQNVVGVSTTAGGGGLRAYAWSGGFGTEISGSGGFNYNNGYVAASNYGFYGVDDNNRFPTATPGRPWFVPVSTTSFGTYTYPSSYYAGGSNTLPAVNVANTQAVVGGAYGTVNQYVVTSTGFGTWTGGTVGNDASTTPVGLALNYNDTLLGVSGYSSSGHPGVGVGDFSSSGLGTMYSNPGTWPTAQYNVTGPCTWAYKGLVITNSNDWYGSGPWYQAYDFNGGFGTLYSGNVGIGTFSVGITANRSGRT